MHRASWAPADSLKTTGEKRVGERCAISQARLQREASRWSTASHLGHGLHRETTIGGCLGRCCCGHISQLETLRGDDW